MDIIIDLTDGKIYDPAMLVAIEFTDLTEKEQDIVSLDNDPDGAWEIAMKHGKPLNKLFLKGKTA